MREHLCLKLERSIKIPRLAYVLYLAICSDHVVHPDAFSREIDSAKREFQ